MHFLPTRPLGWSSFSVLASLEVADLDAKTVKAINGDEGGSWTPSAQIILGGLGLKVTGPANFEGVTTLDEVDDRIGYTSREIERYQSPCDGFGVSWTQGSSGFGVAHPTWTADSAVASFFWQRLTLPVGGVLNSVGVFLDPSSGHAGVPANVPEVGVYRSTFGSDTTTQIGTSAPAFAGTLAAYHAGYLAEADASTETIFSPFAYWARVKNESGANAQLGLKVVSVLTRCTVTSQDEAVT